MVPGMSAALLAETALAASAFLVPTLIMGRCSATSPAKRVRQASAGRAIGVNTLGAALAPLLCVSCC